jgi:hemoglobin-like flavoprotein
VDQQVIELFDQSLQRCNANPKFLDRFYERFLDSSPKVRQKFANTDFVRQKRVLRASFYLILLAAEDEEKGSERYLKELAVRHSSENLDIGSELYDLWLDSLLETVRECDSAFDSKVEEAWERMMGVGIGYLLNHYHHPPR